MVAGGFVPRANGAGGYTPILKPTIFWHDNQWETYENGQWVPYRGPGNNEVIVQPEPEIAPEPIPGPETVNTNIYPMPYGWGYIGAPAFNARHRQHVRGHFRAERGRHERFGQPNAGVGRTTIGIGQPNVGMGQTTIGMGSPNVGIGQANVGIGQRNIGVGKANSSVGQQNVGVGQTTIGIGQLNVGIGHNNSGVGQPNVSLGQPTIGIGQSMSSQPSGWGTRGR